MGKVIKAVRSGRAKQKNDESKFLELIGKLYKHINWFSISSAFVKGEFWKQFLVSFFNFYFWTSNLKKKLFFKVVVVENNFLSCK